MRPVNLAVDFPPHSVCILKTYYKISQQVRIVYSKTFTTQNINGDTTLRSDSTLLSSKNHSYSLGPGIYVGIKTSMCKLAVKKYFKYFFK